MIIRTVKTITAGTLTHSAALRSLPWCSTVGRLMHDVVGFLRAWDDRQVLGGVPQITEPLLVDLVARRRSLQRRIRSERPGGAGPAAE